MPTAPPTAYVPKPKWDGSGVPRQPNLDNQSGYDNRASRLSESRRLRVYQRANATLNDNQWQWPMFIYDLSIDIGLAGTTAQAQLTRDFYPHNFVQPSFTIQGQAIDQEDYGYLCDFIHRAQQNSFGNKPPLLQFWLKGMGADANWQSSQGVAVTSSKLSTLNVWAANQKMRGAHQDILCQGYVGSMPRQHQAGVVSPTYSLQFVVAWMIRGPWHEHVAEDAQQKTWVDLLTGTNAPENFTNQTDLKQNNQVLDWVKKNQWGVFANAGSS